MASVVALLTDFGTRDGYVAAMKGVILGIAPGLPLVDITHEVTPQDVYGGAFLLGTVVDAFGPDTVFLCVVDPGVGADRSPVAIRTPHGTFVGPDNGLFSYALAAYHPAFDATARPTVPPAVTAVATPSGITARRIANERLLRQPVSATFHGRDIFAPVAAHLAAGRPLAGVGPQVRWLRLFQPPAPLQGREGALLGRVVHVDAYGNLITNLRAAGFPPAFHLTIGGRTIQRLSQAYDYGDALLAISGSSGFVEIAAKGGSAAQRLGVGRWAPVLVRPAPVLPPA